MLILGIETSCDETSVALMTEQGEVRSNLIASQIERHRPFGGVVPEIASREHLKHLMPLLEAALEESNSRLQEITTIAVTAGPGLIGALLVGLAGAQGLSYGLGIPLLPVNHLEGHIYSPYLRGSGPALPLPDQFYAMVVSGGHSSIYDVRGGEKRSIEMRNRTRDDAAGEVFDKVAKFIGLPYPGGPQVDRLAREGDAGRFEFPLARFKDESADFSFSGLKANAIRMARDEGLAAIGEAGASERGEETARLLRDFCASFQKAIIDQLIDRLIRVWPADGGGPQEVALAGGVAANGALRSRMESWAAERGVVLRLPERRYCTDNAAMIAFAGLQHFLEGGGESPLRVAARSRMPVVLGA